MKRVGTAILSLALLAPATPAPAQQAAPIEVRYERFVLPNGLTVVLHEDHSIPMASVNTWYHVGSAREEPDRTGFAHLFEHLMFEGSGNVPEGKFDQWLEAAGGDNNGSTTPDRTNYYEDVPSNAVELALFLESDRMGHLLEAMSPTSVDGQRDVVKNERRQSYENRPYGMAWITLYKNLYPPNHPYHWPTIGSMKDLSAAGYEDVVGFFRRYYGPNNASLVIAGDIDPKRTRAQVEKWFADVPARPRVPPLAPPPPVLTEEKRVILEDRVQLPRLYMCWLTPAHLAPGDAEMDLLGSVLTDGKNSRLYRRMVYETRIAQDVNAFQASRALASHFCVMSTARSGHSLAEIENAVQEEIARIRREPPDRRELERSVHQRETSFLRQLERVGGFGGVANQLNSYLTATGNPDYFQEDLARYQALGPGDLSAAAITFLRDDARVVLSVVPDGRADLAAPGSHSTRREAK